ncbi:hypothetical protein GCM10020331_015440 [Ectobacillus funiculus]
MLLEQKYGLPFPVLVRAAFGYKGAHIPVLVRAFVAIFWFAVQAYAGSKAVGAVLGVLIPGWASLASYHVIGMGLNDAIALVLFWVLHAYIISHGMERVKFFELWAGPLVIILGLGLVAWAIYTADGMGPLFQEKSTLSGAEFWKVFRDLSYRACRNMGHFDFEHSGFYPVFAEPKKDQVVGQAIGLPGTAIIFSLMSVIITSGTIIAFGRPIWDPVELLQQFDNPLVLIFRRLLSFNCYFISKCCGKRCFTSV